MKWMGWGVCQSEYMRLGARPLLSVSLNLAMLPFSHLQNGDSASLPHRVVVKKKGAKPFKLLA